jgi:hypothetical protein
MIYTKSMEEGAVPSDWKEANVTPIFKTGAKSQPSNYRPVSLTSVACKMMESLIRDKITDHLELNIINKSLSIDLEPQGITCVLLHPGFVRTDMVGGRGYISAAESAAGLLAVLDSGRELNGRWYDYAGKDIKW